jgi:uncharacterized protein
MIPLRLVLDTNVIVSAALKPDGSPRAVLTLALTKPAQLYVSQEIFAEYKQVLARPKFRIRRGLRIQFLQLIRNRARFVHLKKLLEIAKDPDDNKFLECADSARADYIVTGNPRHFPRYWKNTKVITPADLLTIAAPHLIP